MATKPIDNIVQGLTFGLGLVTITALFNYFSKLAGDANILQQGDSIGTNLDNINYNDYSLYGYTEPVNPVPTPLELTAYGDERYNPGLSYYAYDILESQTRTPEEGFNNTIPPLNVDE